MKRKAIVLYLSRVVFETPPTRQGGGLRRAPGCLKLKRQRPHPPPQTDMFFEHRIQVCLRKKGEKFYIFLFIFMIFLKILFVILFYFKVPPPPTHIFPVQDYCVLLSLMSCHDSQRADSVPKILAFPSAAAAEEQDHAENKQLSLDSSLWIKKNVLIHLLVLPPCVFPEA